MTEIPSMAPTYIGLAITAVGVVIQFATSLPGLVGLGIVIAGMLIVVVRFYQVKRRRDDALGDRDR